MGKKCGAWVSRRLWGGSNTSPLKTTAWEATTFKANRNYIFARFLTKNNHSCTKMIVNLFPAH